MILNWFKGGLLLGSVFFLAMILVKPIGVSTQFVIADGLMWQAVDSTLITANETAKSTYSSTNAYLNKSGGKYAANIANPLNYSFIFVLALALGAFISSRLRGGVSAQDKVMPPVWRERFGDSHKKRYLYAFLGGIIVLFGARLAGGCTSGHMMSGMMQTSISGFLFAVGAFATAIPLALYLYRKGK